MVVGGLRQQVAVATFGGRGVSLGDREEYSWKHP